MNTQTTAPVVPVVPVVLPQATFAAFKADEQISFVRTYDPKVTAIDGMRHAVLRYRNTDGKSTKAAQMVTVPALKLPEHYELVPPTELQVIQGMYEDEQDKIIRSLVDKQASNIGWSLVTFDCVIASMTAERVSQRLTKEQIEGWSKIAFVAQADTRSQEISSKAGHNAEQIAKQKAGTLTAYCNLAMKLAAPVPNVGENEAKALQAFITAAKLDDDLAKVLLKKLHAILHPDVVENGDL